MLVISCHADTNFRAHQLRRVGSAGYRGHMDNFAGVHAVMRAYFSGRLAGGQVRIELTHGEETSFAGARAVLPTLHPDDLVVVVDVTGVPTASPFTIEKCRDSTLAEYLSELLRDLSPDINPSAPDPIADEDESDVYSLRCPFTCFLGLVCRGGDYNEEEVELEERSIAALSEALCRLAEDHSNWQQKRPRAGAPRPESLQCNIRPPRPEDRAEWQRMRAALWPDCSEDELQDALDAGAVFVAELPDGTLAGFCEVDLREQAEGCSSSPVGYLEGWWVDPRWRRRGLGARLVRAAEEWSREQGVIEFASDAALDNVLSQMCHEALGFERDLELVCYRRSLA